MTDAVSEKRNSIEAVRIVKMVINTNLINYEITIIRVLKYIIITVNLYKT